MQSVLGGAWEQPGDRWHAVARFAANLQVFCREKSGNDCPMSVCL
jgi:hypothetical protein